MDFKKFREQAERSAKAAGSSIKASYETKQAELRQQKMERGAKLASIAISYVGGYSEPIKPGPGTLSFYENRIEFTNGSRGNLALMVPLANVRDIAIEGSQEVSRRITATRLVTLGVFALAWKKKRVDKEAYLTIIFADGTEALFEAKKISPFDLKKRLSNVTSVNKRQNAQAPTGGADELIKYAELLKQGIITQAEFDAQKRRILG